MKHRNILKYVLFCTSFLSILTIQAQEAKFEKAGAFGSAAADEPYFSTTDKEGNYYIVGVGGGDISFSDQISIKGKGNKDALLVKYDQHMNILWARSVGGSGVDSFESMAITSTGDVVVTGQISGLATIDGTDMTLQSKSATDGVIVVFNSSGEYKTSALIQGAGNSLCYSVAVDKQDNIIVTGATNGNTSFGNDKTISLNEKEAGMFLAKYGKDLTCEWAIAGKNGTAPTYGWALTLDPEENILVAGRFGTSIMICGTDNKEITNELGQTTADDVFITKISPEGTCQWIRTITNGTKRIDARSIATDSNGCVVVAGSSNAAVAFEGQEPFAFSGNFDGYVIKISSAGEYLNGFSIGGANRDELKSVFVDKDNNILIAGNMNGVKTGTSVNMNPKGTPSNHIFKGHDGFFAKYDGNTLLLQQIEKTITPVDATQHEVAWSVTMSKDFNKIYTAGHFNNSATIFNGEGGNQTLPLVGNYDCYYVVYSGIFQIKTDKLPDGKVGEPYYSSIETVNAQHKLDFQLTHGQLPVGITLSKDGVFSGVPTESGQFSFTITIADNDIIQHKEYSIFISNGNPCDIFIVSDGCPNAFYYQNYSFQVVIEGEYTNCSIVAGALPDGLTISSTGLISGAPFDSNAEGIYTFTLRVEKNKSCFEELTMNMLLVPFSNIDKVEGVLHFYIHPNLVEKDLFIRADFESNTKSNVTILSTTAVKVWESNYQGTVIDESIPVDSFSPGLYYVILTTEKGRSAHKIIVR